MILKKSKSSLEKEIRVKKKENLKDLNRKKKEEKKISKILKNKLKGQNKISDEIRSQDKKFLKTLSVKDSVQATVDYISMFEDGVCKVDEGLYSKTIKFSDINYQLSNRSEQINIFSRYCEFLNYFDPSINVQITINNKRLAVEDFKSKMLLHIPTKDDGANMYRREYNNMLKDKAMQGQNGIIREKYLTFSVNAKNYEQAVQLLSRIEADIKGNIKRLGCSNITLNGYERSEFIHSILNPDDMIIC